jgi:hypothetical protein
LAFGANLNDLYFLPNGSGGVLQVLQLARGGKKVRVRECGNDRRFRKEIAQQPQSLRLRRGGQEAHASDIAARAAEAGD